ncbi:uncharacterized protein SPSC_06558 [Sporisorium scitamineum]|uniref:Macrofage activating glycoprotein n=1 Tax=Sporisorium scitamineum TaxID=49012 RepID=A0A0F7RXD3_9BASI|nr:hypothetical protein [Sporisorium scitamineum]CDU26364.1 uncharacterized protein SPSC_06558 [Sporisorium scitamineum]
MTRTLLTVTLVAAALALPAAAQNKPNFNVNSLPDKWEANQAGSNQCTKWGASSSSSLCQNVFINNANDFCLWGPINPNSQIGASEESVVSYCLKSGYGTRLIPNGSIQGVQFLKTPDFLQVTGVGDFTRMNIQKGDAGGELDPHGADGTGNPKGGLVFSNNVPGSEGKFVQIKEWNNFMSAYEFSFRAAYGPNAAQYAPHVYDAMGAYFNSNRGKFEKGVFEDCRGDSGKYPGVYKGSTFRQGQAKTPAPHKAAPSSKCKAYPTVANGPAPQKAYKRTVAKPLK